MCEIPTFIGKMLSMDEMLALGRPVSTQIMHEQQAKALNQDLKNCGNMPECRWCNIQFGVQVSEVGKRVAVKLK